MIACKPSNEREVYASNPEFPVCLPRVKNEDSERFMPVHIITGGGREAVSIFYPWETQFPCYSTETLLDSSVGGSATLCT